MYDGNIRHGRISINQSLLSIQANNNDNIHTFVNMNTESARN